MTTQSNFPAAHQSSVMNLLSKSRAIKLSEKTPEILPNIAVEAMIKRLDLAFLAIEKETETENEHALDLKAQSILYASLLTDITNGTIVVNDVVLEALDVITEFCILIESRPTN